MNAFLIIGVVLAELLFIALGVLRVRKAMQLGGVRGYLRLMKELNHLYASRDEARVRSPERVVIFRERIRPLEWTASRISWYMVFGLSALGGAAAILFVVYRLVTS